MADTARPRPRPRPKPIAKKPVAPNASSDATPGASGSSGSGIPLSSQTRRVIDVQDTDEMFIRNRNRKAEHWRKMEQINRGAYSFSCLGVGMYAEWVWVEVVKVVNEDESDSDNNNGRSPRRKNKRKKSDPSAAPLWHQGKELKRMLSEALSDSDSDSDLEIIDNNDGSSPPTGKRKRKLKQRSRSRSITPPPALPQHQIQNAKNVVRQTLASAPRAPSPTLFDPDDSTDTIILQPELTAIAQEIASHSQYTYTPSHLSASKTTHEEEDGSEDHVVLDVKWQRHPLDLDGMEDEWQYKINRKDNFRDLYEAVAEDANVMTDSLVLTYKGKRFFPSVTPHTLNIWTDSAQFVACIKTTYDYIRAHPTSIKHPPFSHSASTPAPDHASPPPETQTQPDSDAESESDSDKFKLVLRSAATGTKEITLTVRPTTKCGAIVRAFLKKAGLADQYPGVFVEAEGVVDGGKKGKAGKGKKGGKGEEKDPRLCLDGDRLENGAEIGEAELEDGDMIEVVGL
ncbi:hypothetical protein B0H34DRAFT_707321 [Crassisporium funariophilum]|nr:hypothetical protein B0H34DRAFT_707321 [Crassisporium funariophilum]